MDPSRWTDYLIGAGIPLVFFGLPIFLVAREWRRARRQIRAGE